jgi:hypothetical protein
MRKVVAATWLAEEVKEKGFTDHVVRKRGHKKVSVAM